MYSLSEIQEGIKEYKIKQILSSGENDMFDNKIDRKAVEECLLQEEEKVDKLNLKQTFENIEEDKLLESIINLKDRHVERDCKFSN